jgi:hypothetical protein
MALWVEAIKWGLVCKGYALARLTRVILTIDGDRNQVISLKDKNPIHRFSTGADNTSTKIYHLKALSEAIYYECHDPR